MLALKKKKSKYPLKEDKVYVGAGMDLLTKEIGKIYWDKPHYQAVVFGGSGSGKSELIARWTYEAILDGKQTFLIDPKGSKSWLEAFFLACHKKGILYDKEKGPVILTLPYPEISVKINPLYKMNPHQIASTVSSGVPVGKEPFFKDIAYEVVLVSALGLKARGVDEIILSDIYKYLRVESLQELQAKVLEDASINPERKELAQEALMTLDKIATYDPQYFPRVNSSLRTYLTRLITGNAGKILNVRAGNILWDRLEKGNLKFFAFLNAEAMRQIAYDVGRLLFANLLIYIGQQSQQLKIIEPQLRTIVDEATEVGFSELNKAIRLVRERNVSVSIFTQSPSGFASAFGQNGKNMVIDIVNSCDLRIGLRLASTEDRKFMADMSPEVSKGQLMLHQNSMNLYYREDKLIKPFDFERLDRGFGYAFLDKTVYYFYSPLVKKYDKTKVKVVFTDNPEDVKADVVINVKDISKNYPKIESDGRDIIDTIDDKSPMKQTNLNKTNKSEENMLVILMKEIHKNYKVNVDEEFKDVEIKRFYEKFRDYFKFYKDDLNKILSMFDFFKDTVSSVPGNQNNPLARIDLLDHSLRTAINSYEEVKNVEGLSQEEKELVILAALSHDIGKAFVNTKSYESKDHERITRQILEKIDVNPVIIKLASSHHEKPEKLGHLGKLLKYVSISDHQARKEEAEKVKTTIGNEMTKKIPVDKVLNNILNQAMKTKDILTNKAGTQIYVSKDYIYRLIERQLKKQEKEILNDDFIKSLFPNSEFKRLKGYTKQGAIKINSIYLVIPLKSPLQINKTNLPKETKEIEKIEID